nr:hypothetical protein [Tanacetum cinerariifolium]
MNILEEIFRDLGYIDGRILFTYFRGSKGDGVVIEEIVDHDVKDAVRKEFDGESGNSDKLPLLEWNQSSQVRKDETIVDNDFCVFDYDNEFPPPWSPYIMITSRTKRLSDEFEFKKLLENIDHAFGLENSSLFAIYDQPINDERDVVPVEVVVKEMVAEKAFDGDDGEQQESNRDVIPK